MNREAMVKRFGGQREENAMPEEGIGEALAKALASFESRIKALERDVADLKKAAIRWDEWMQVRGRRIDEMWKIHQARQT
jgi:hypothetical protein